MGTDYNHDLYVVWATVRVSISRTWLRWNAHLDHSNTIQTDCHCCWRLSWGCQQQCYWHHCAFIWLQLFPGPMAETYEKVSKSWTYQIVVVTDILTKNSQKHTECGQRRERACEGRRRSGGPACSHYRTWRWWIRRLFNGITTTSSISTLSFLPCPVSGVVWYTGCKEYLCSNIAPRPWFPMKRPYRVG